jgi:signal transduction histidine kinase
LKFTDRGFVALAILLKKKGCLEFKVEDSGMGISENYLKVIFERFRRIEGDATLDLSGLGLSITKAWVGDQSSVYPWIGICYIYHSIRYRSNG